MLIKEKIIVDVPFARVLVENGDMWAHYRDHPEDLWDKMIEDFEGSKVKFKNWCKKSYLGARGPHKADHKKFDKAMEYFDSKFPELSLNEAFQYEDILQMSFKDLIAHNGGNTMQTLRDLGSLMSRIQGTDDEEQRKAYFKAKKFYEKLVAQTNQ